MKEVHCIISLGSNTDASHHLQQAYNLLVRAYPNITFSPIKETEPIGMHHNHSPFYNRIARFTTDQNADEVRAALKVMERFCGRRPDDKEHETIHIDIDLLAHGDTIIKPMDFAQYQHDIENL